jgi:signal transduction histidine kinase
MKSLQLRLTTGLFISLLSVFLIMWWMRGESFKYLAKELVASHLTHDAASLLSEIYIDTVGNIHLDTSHIEPDYRIPFSGQYFRIIANGQVIDSNSLRDNWLDVPELKPGETSQYVVSEPMQQQLLIVVFGLKKQGHNITIAMAENLLPVLSRINSLQFWYSLIILVLFMLLIAVHVMLLRIGFSQLTRVQQQIRELELGKLSQLDTNVPEEVSGLVHEVNWLLNILDSRLQRSRNALGDLAHALKTPLTILQQLLHDERIIAQTDLFNIMQAQTCRMQEIMDRKLKGARMAGAGHGSAIFDVHQELVLLIQVLENMYRKKNLQIVFLAPKTGKLVIDREDMLELTGNLLDNACKWARSKVIIKVGLEHGAYIKVEDDGPGVSDEALETLIQRGKRLDETISGHGLGLSIVQLIVESYGGQLILGRSKELGGFSVEARLLKPDSVSDVSREDN